MAKTQPGSYRAFVSYSHADKRWGCWIHRAIERYRPPRLVGIRRGRIRPVFRDDEETAASADLDDVILQALAASEALVVVCSPNSARSGWVDKEVRDFKALGRETRIYTLIVDGVPGHPEHECFPPSLKRRAVQGGALADVPIEPLAIDVRAHGRKDSVLKIAAGLLGVPYDALKRRDRARAVRRAAAVVIGILAILLAYTASLVAQTRAVNAQISSILSALARKATDETNHARALRLAVLSARSGLLFPPVPEAEPVLARAAHYSTLGSVLDGHRFAVYSAVWDDTGGRLVTGSQDNTVRVWRVDGKGLWGPAGPALDTGWAVEDARFSEPKGTIAVRPLGPGGINLWRLSGNSWTGPQPLGDQRAMVRAFDMTPRGNFAAIGLQDGALEVWQFADGQWHLETRLSTDDRIPEAIAIANDGSLISASLLDGTLRIWHRNADHGWSPAVTLPQFQIRVRQLAFTASGERLLSVGSGQVRILRREPGGGWTPIGRISEDRQVTAAAFVPPDGTLLVTNASGASAILWAEEGESAWAKATTFGTGTDFSRVVAFDPDGGRLVTAGNDAAIRIWVPGESGSWHSIAKLAAGIGRVRDAASWIPDHTGFKEPRIESPDGRRVVTGDVYGIISVRDVATSLDVATFDASDTPRYTLAWHNAGQALLVRPPDTEVPLKTIFTRFSVALSGDALVDAVCAEKLHGSTAILSQGDIAAAPILRGRESENVCDPPSLWHRSWESLRLLFGRSG